MCLDGSTARALWHVMQETGAMSPAVGSACRGISDVDGLTWTA